MEPIIPGEPQGNEKHVCASMMVLHGKKCLEHLELQASNCRHGDNGKVYGLIGAPVLLPHMFQYQTAQCGKNEEHKNAHGRAAGFAGLFQLPFQSLLSLLSQVARDATHRDYADEEHWAHGQPGTLTWGQRTIAHCTQRHSGKVETIQQGLGLLLAETKRQHQDET